MAFCGGKNGDFALWLKKFGNIFVDYGIVIGW